MATVPSQLKIETDRITNPGTDGKIATASGIVNIPSGSVSATDVQGAIDELAAGPGGGVTSFETRTGAVVSAAGDYTAAEVTNTPSGGIVATDVQGAIDELAEGLGGGAVWMRANFATSTAFPDATNWQFGAIIDQSDPGDFTVDLGAGTITFNKAGAYDVTAQTLCQVSSASTPLSAALYIRINGSNKLRANGIRYSSATGDVVFVSGNGVADFEVGDVLTFVSASGGGTTMTSNSAAVNNLVSVSRVGGGGGGGGATPNIILRPTGSGYVTDDAITFDVVDAGRGITAGASSLTIEEAGLYELNMTIGFDLINPVENAFVSARMEVGGSTRATVADRLGSATGTGNHMSASSLVRLEAGDVATFLVFAGPGRTLTMLADGTTALPRISLTKIPATGAAAEINPSATVRLASGAHLSTSDIPFQSFEQVSDPAHFTVDNGAGTVTINVAGAYLFSGTIGATINSALDNRDQNILILNNLATWARLGGVRPGTNTAARFWMTGGGLVRFEIGDVLSFRTWITDSTSLDASNSARRVSLAWVSA